ncbi:hypothetical protein DSO57_1008534 [Entomophthora muscae]|uniref:Uncharacterized protein n=1 Tax=Entomophthora muscae TaxID=34485 RepID=A0ACC2UHP9_9FUNG|nr:hypothetical protein DSO57_1008534 [Entomophthora muscae]
MAKIPNTPVKTIKCLLNIQKTVVEGLQFKSYALSTPFVWANDPEMYEHLKPINSVATKVQTSSANVSYNTQGALNELPLDVSNIMNESGGNVEWQELHPN